MDSVKFLEILKNEKEMEPDLHDGSYEIMREVLNTYSKISDFSVLDYTDMDIIYLTAVGTFSDGFEAKKNRVRNSHLPESDKTHLLNVMEDVWENACTGKYSNGFNGKDGGPSFGMFGTGFLSFKRYSNDDNWNQQMREFIKMLIMVHSLDDEEVIFEVVNKLLCNRIKGFQAASVSEILHCIKPFVFPILNGHSGQKDSYDLLNINLNRKKEATTYIENCRTIKEFRDGNLPFKNYRILDLKAFEINEKIDNPYEGYWPSLAEYDPCLTKVDWIEFLTEDRKTHPQALKMLKVMYDLGGEASCSTLSEKIPSNSPSAFISRGANLGKRVCNYFNISPCVDEKGKEWPFTVPFVGKHHESDNNYIWRLRFELRDAIAELDLEEPEIIEMKKTDIEKNTILYGPPGTGKTYNTAAYAVAIVEDVPLSEVLDEDREAIQERYADYCKEGLIEFTTFHQSYSYEEFIEGIRPLMEDNDDDENSDIQYIIKPGVFKAFCDKAKAPIIDKNSIAQGINDNPKVWKVSLGGTYDNEVRRDCLANGYIRIGWTEYGENISDETDFTDGGKNVLNAFINKMQIGDIVVSCYTATTTDAIGIVTGDYEWDDDLSNYKRLRKVNWLVKNINEDIKQLNNNRVMSLPTVYEMNILPADILGIVAKYTPQTISSKKKNYVFIIDEINRGNISKIFGELITLIEKTKRLGQPEGMSVKLPYSQKPFGVPDNVYILGTMNTADRSIALLDTALRRRFTFREMMPKPELLNSVIIEGLSIGKMLDNMNKKITVLFDREHTIGHAYFMTLNSNSTVRDLAVIFENCIIPLLQEYFYDDYEKIRLVLGDNNKQDDKLVFVKATATDNVGLFGSVSFDFDETFTYEINEKAFDEIDSYKSI